MQFVSAFGVCWSVYNVHIQEKTTALENRPYPRVLIIHNSLLGHVEVVHVHSLIHCPQYFILFLMHKSDIVIE